MKKFFRVALIILAFILIRGLVYLSIENQKEKSYKESIVENNKIISLSKEIGEDIAKHISEVMSKNESLTTEEKIQLLDGEKLSQSIEELFVSKVSKSDIKEENKKLILNELEKVVVFQKDLTKMWTYIEGAFLNFNFSYIDNAENLIKSSTLYTEEMKNFFKECKNAISKIKNNTYTTQDQNNLVYAQEKAISSLQRITSSKTKNF